MEKLIEDFKKARQNLIQTLDEIPENKRNKILFHYWTAKDLLSHMSGWMISATNNVECLKKGKTPPRVGNDEDFNRESVEKRKNWSWDEVYKELVKTSEEFAESYKDLPKDLWQKRYWPEKDFTPKKILEIEIEHWEEEHLSQIAKLTN
jgi:hypothetical protein